MCFYFFYLQNFIYSKKTKTLTISLRKIICPFWKTKLLATKCLVLPHDILMRDTVLHWKNRILSIGHGYLLGRYVINHWKSMEYWGVFWHNNFAQLLNFIVSLSIELIKTTLWQTETYTVIFSPNKKTPTRYLYWGVPHICSDIIFITYFYFTLCCHNAVLTGYRVGRH